LLLLEFANRIVEMTIHRKQPVYQARRVSERG